MSIQSNQHDLITGNDELWADVNASKYTTHKTADEFLHAFQMHQVELEKSLERYKDFFEYAPVGYITLTHEGMIDEVNLTASAMLGADSIKLSHQYFANFVSVENLDQWHQYFSNVLDSQETLVCELELRHGNNTSFYAKLNCVCLKNKEMSPVVRVVLSDAQLEKIHNQALIDIEYQKYALDQHSIVAITDVNGTITYVNDKFCDISKFTRDELVGKNHRLINSGTHPKEFFQDMFCAITSGRVWQGDICNRAKDGSLYWVATTIVPSMDEDGLPFQYVSVRTDITDNKKAEIAHVEELLKASEDMRIFVKQAPISISMFDCSMNYLATSDQWIKDYGRGFTNLVGRNHYEIHPDISDDWKNIQQQCMMGVMFKNEEEFWEQSDGRKQWLSWSFLPWRYPDGRVGGIIISVIDITESKLIEQELKTTNHQLTDELAKRAADLSALTAHIQTVAEKERAQLARELHDDMGSILTALSMEVGRLQRKTSDPNLLDDLKVIRTLISEVVLSKRNIINQLYPTVLDVYGFTHAMNIMSNEFRKHSGIDVEIFMPSEDIVMSPDNALAAYRIAQECLNNIAKHSGASRVQIEVAAKDGFLNLTLHDNGKGLPGEISKSRHGIFGMTERARYLGGSMVIASEDGKGTTANLFLPLFSIKPKDKKRVLVVDDHAIVRNAIRQLIERETSDFSVEGEATDGMAAIQMVIDEEWDIMLLDVNLPKKNGIEVLEAIKKVKSSLPVIMLSNEPENEYAEKALAKGASFYIEKGKTDKLVEAMRRVTTMFLMGQ